MMRLRWVGGALMAGLVVLAGGPRTLFGQDASASTCLVPDTALAKRGQAVFTNKGCNACHTIGGGKLAGPDLAGVTQQRDLAWLRRWLRNPTEMLETDSIAKALLAQYNNMPMPNLRLKDEEVEALLSYMAPEGSKIICTGR